MLGCEVRRVVAAALAASASSAASKGCGRNYRASGSGRAEDHEWTTEKKTLKGDVMQSLAQIQGTFFPVWIGLIWATVTAFPDDKPSSLNIPPVIHNGPSTHIIYNTGGRIILPCRASGFPLPRFQWYRNSEQIETSNDTSALYYVRDASLSGDLHLKTLSSVTEGYYQCFAVNSVGISMSNISFVQEAVFEDHVLRRRVNNVTVAEGGHLTLPCNHFRSIPAASITWYSANHSLEKTKPVVVPLGRRVAMDDNGNLIFTVVTKDDASEGIVYECHAYNYVSGQTSTGSYFKITLLQAMYKMDSVPELVFSSSRVSAVGGTNVTLTCLFSSRLIAQIEWSRQSDVPLPASASVTDDSQHLLLKHVSAKDSGSYICRGSNALGQTQATISLVVLEPPRLKFPLLSQTVNTGDSVSFQCQAEDVDSNEVQWFYNSQEIENATAVQRNWTVDGDKLILLNVHSKDMGIFTCNVSNSYGSIVSNAYLVVRSSSTLPLDADEKDQTENYSPSIVSHIKDVTEPVAASNDSFLNETSDYLEQNVVQSVQLNTNDSTTDLVTTLSIDDVSYFTRYGLHVQGNSNKLISYGVGLLQKKDIISTIWIVIPIAFLLMFLTFLYHRVTSNKRSYRVYKQEQRRGCHVIEYDSDDSGYGEQKTENAVSHMKTTLPPVPDQECYL